MTKISSVLKNRPFHAIPTTCVISLEKNISLMLIPLSSSLFNIRSLSSFPCIHGRIWPALSFARLLRQICKECPTRRAWPEKFLCIFWPGGLAAHQCCRWGKIALPSQPQGLAKKKVGKVKAHQRRHSHCTNVCGLRSAAKGTVKKTRADKKCRFHVFFLAKNQTFFLILKNIILIIF